MAIVVASEVITLRAPQYGSDPRVPALLILADEFLGDKIPTTNPREYAKALQVLHWLTMDDRNKNGNVGTGAISEEKEGELTVKYSAVGANVMAFTSDWKNELGQTTWGLELYGFCKRYFVSALTRFC